MYEKSIGGCGHAERFIDGALGTKEAQEIVGRVAEKIRTILRTAFMPQGIPMRRIIWKPEGKHLPVPHCIRESEGWQIRKEIQEAMPHAVIVDKPSFASLELADLLCRENEREELEIELVGLCTDICVVSNALLLKARLPETKISVDPSCCAGVTPESHEAALLTMKMCQIAQTEENRI